MSSRPTFQDRPHEQLLLENFLKPETSVEPAMGTVSNLEQEHLLAVQKFLAGEDDDAEEEELDCKGTPTSFVDLADAISTTIDFESPPGAPVASDSSSSSKLILEELITPSTSYQANADDGTVRAKLLAQALRPFPKALYPEDWIKITFLIQSSIRDLYAAGRQSTVSAVQERMRHYGAQEHLVVNVTRYCAELSAVFSLWAPPGHGELCILAGPQPDAEPPKAKEVEFRKALAARLRKKFASVAR